MELAYTRTRKSYGSQLQQYLLVAFIHQTENLKETDNNTNAKNFYGYAIYSEEHQLEINGTIRISIQ